MNERLNSGWSKTAARIRHRIQRWGPGPAIYQTRIVTNKSGTLSDDTLAVITRLVHAGLV